MELTKAQVAKIEKYLEIKGVEYWDIRIEMLDHIATDIEQRMELGSSFEEAKKEALKEKGWSGSIKGIFFQRTQSVHKRVRGQYLRELTHLFTHFSSLSLIVLAVFSLLLLYSKVDYSISHYISLSIYLAPVVIAIFLIIKSFLFKKTAYMNYANLYILFPFMITNFILAVVRDGSESKEIYEWVLFSVSIINALSTYAGVKTYLSVRKEVQKMQKQLKLL